MDILLQQEKIGLDVVLGHGGLFKTPGVGQSILAAAINAPVTVMETAGEGGAWGIALLADYMLRKQEGESLESYLNSKVFSGMAATTLPPDAADVAGFNAYMARYTACIAAEKAAVEGLR